MRLLLNKRLHVNMGNYEHVEMVATVEINTETDKEILAANGVDDLTDLPSLETFVVQEANNLLFADVEDAHYMTDREDSFIHEYHKEHNKEKK